MKQNKKPHLTSTVQIIFTTCTEILFYFPDELSLELKRILPSYMRALCTKVVNYF